MKTAVFFCVCFVATVICLGQNRKVDSLQALVGYNNREDERLVDLLNELSFQIIKNDPAKSLEHATRALHISQRLNYYTGEIIARNNLAAYYLTKGKHDVALNEGLRAEHLGDSLHNDQLRAETYSILGTIYGRQRDFDKAIQCYNQAEFLNKGNIRTLVRILNGKGLVFRDQRKFDSALLFYQKAIQVISESRDDYRLGDVLNNIGTVHLRQGKYSTALEYFNKSLEVAVTNGSLRTQAMAMTNIGAVYIVTKNYERAQPIEQSALILAKKLNDIYLVQQAYLGLGEIMMATGKHQDAGTYMMAYYRLNDSLINAEKNARIAELEVRYETEKKNKIIESLAYQNQIQKLNQVYLYVGVFTIALVFAAIYILQRRYNSKAKALLVTQKQLNSTLKEADKVKSGFFAMISHEFRTPLSLIIGPIESRLNSKSISLADRKEFNLIRRNANRLLSLVNQLLDLSKIEARSMELILKQGDPHTFITILTASFDSLAESKNIKFIKQISAIGADAWYDEDKLEKIINNVLFNAFKFTPHGGTVWFSCSASDVNLQIEVKDTGKGISDEEQRHIFTPYYQSDSVADASELGTGLGLSLVKELVKLHGGKISLESKIDEGTTIFIVLPVVAANIPSSTTIRYAGPGTMDSKERPVEPIEPIENDFDGDDESLKQQADVVLIVEDNQDLRTFMSYTLREEFRIVTATNGQEGVEMATAQIPNLILSDVLMPSLNGIQLTQKIKEDERTCHIPVVLLTAKADHESRMEGFRAGADDYLTKPFSVEELRLRVFNLIEQRKKLAALYRAEIGNTAPLAPVITLDEKFLSKVKHVVQQNLADPGFGVEQMASEVHLSRAQLFRKLKAIAGISPNELINEVRLQRAAELIASKADTLAQISYSVGFNEQSYFTKRFRQKFGMTPSEFSAKKH